MKTYTLAQQWGPAYTWLIESHDLEDGKPPVPLWKRHLQTAGTVARYAAKYGEPTTAHSKEQLAKLPTLRP